VVEGLKRTVRFIISDEDQDWIHTIYPRLEFKGGQPPRSLVGLLDFDYAPPQRSSAMTDKGSDTSRIRDSYNIQVLFDEPRPAYSFLPAVREIDGRIEKSGQMHGITSPLDMHITSQGQMCPCAPLEESRYLPDGFSLDQYISRLIVPFLYGQSFFERYGVWPWGTRSHGLPGFLESYAELSSSGTVDPFKARRQLESVIESKNDSSAERIRKALEAATPPHGHMLCPCGSGRRFRECHAQAFQGLWHLWRDTRESGRHNS
jgi:hypothetical protein